MPVVHHLLSNLFCSCLDSIETSQFREYSDLKSAMDVLELGQIF